MLLTAVSLPVFNVLVDPYDVFHSWTVAGFNREKTERLTRGGRLTKSLDLRGEQFETVLMGSSRVLLGMDPDAPALDGQDAYNAGLGGTNMYELASVLDFIGHYQPNLELLVLGLDFSMFNRNRTVNGDYAVSGFAGRSDWQLYSYLLFSQAASFDSLYTLVANRSGDRAAAGSDGHQDAPPMHVLDEQGARRAFAAVISQFRDDTDTYVGLAADGRYDAERLALLREALDEASSAGVEVKIFISPIHALLIETMDRMGIAALYAQWKRDLVAMVDEINQAHPSSPPVQLWDFGDYNTVTTERVPGPGEAAPMRGYWEPSHYRREIGDLVLARMLGSGAAQLPEDFGVLLAPDTIERQEGRMGVARAAYRAANGPDIEALVEGRPGPVIASEAMPAASARW